MRSKYHKFFKDHYKYLIIKGEQKAHNNSKILKKKLKDIIAELANDTKKIQIA